jgi:hypothetical protein
MKTDGHTPNLADLVHKLNSMIKDLRYLEALDEFYDENIVTCENENEPIVGLAKYRERGKGFLKIISNYSAELKNVVVSEDMSVTEWHYKFDNKITGPWECTQLSLQRWKNGKIIHERHHYLSPSSSV